MWNQVQGKGGRWLPDNGVVVYYQEGVGKFLSAFWKKKFHLPSGLSHLAEKFTPLSQHMKSATHLGLA